MDLSGLRSLVRDANFSIHGVPATVTPPASAAVGTRIIWLVPQTIDVPVGEFQRREPRRVMAIRRDEVPEVPRGTLVSVNEPLLSSPSEWKVDALEERLPDQHRVVVVPSSEAC